MLGISRDGTTEEIRKAYRNKAKRYHPDVNPAQDAHEQFIEISEAYEVLRDPETRANDDRLWRNNGDKSSQTG
ncbi:MAG: DnaJ domain-containing protein [Caldibacillus sp.]